jgi:DNA-binding MarR family transcriptional regulator
MEAKMDSVDLCTADAVARYEEIDPEVEGVVDRIASINRYVARAFEDTLNALGLTHGEYKVLLRLAIAPTPRRLTAGDLSRGLMLSTGGMTNRLDRLEGAKLIRRLPDPDDRRGVLVELTDEGSDLIDRAVVEEAAKERGLFDVFSAKELRDLNRLLRKSLGALEDRFAAPERAPSVRTSRNIAVDA